jgi:aspartate/methionine/tyrosine aminotransferase
MLDALAEAGFRAIVPRGTYFVLAGFSGLFEGDDVAFVRHLVESRGVAAVPPSAFYRSRPEEGRQLVRFAFCKRRETLEAAAGRLRGLRGETRGRG